MRMGSRVLVISTVNNFQDGVFFFLTCGESRW